MSFSISYVYTLVDKFTPKLREIEKATREFNASIGQSSVQAQKLNEHMNKVGRSTASAQKGLKKATDAMSQGAFSNAGYQRFQKRMKGMRNGLESFGSSASGLASSLGAGLFLNKIKNDSMALESSLIDLTKVFDLDSPGAMKSFQDSLASVGRTVGQSRTDINKLAYEAGKLGIELKDVPGFAELTGKTAVALDMDLSQATDALANLRNKMGLGNDDLIMTLDTINAIADATSASGEGILNIMGRNSGVFKALNVAPEVAAGFSAMAEQLSHSPEVGARSLRMFIAGLQDVKKVSPEVGKALSKDFQGTIEKVLANLRGMDDATRNLTILQTFGEEAAPFIMNLVTSQELLNKTFDKARDKIGNAGSAEREFARQAASTKFKVDQMKASLSNMAASIGMVVLPALQGITEAVARAASEFAIFAEANPGFAQFLVIGTGILAISAPMALAFSAMAGGVQMLAGALMFLAATPVGLTITGIAAIIAGVTWAYNKFETFRVSIQKVGRLLENVGLAMANPWDMGKYLNRDVGYNYDNENRKIVEADYGSDNSFVNNSGFSSFLSSQSLSAQKEQSVTANIFGNIDVVGAGGAKVGGATFGSNMPGNLGANIANKKGN